MSIPVKFRILVLTLSDRAFRGDYQDLSGPKTGDFLKDFFNSVLWEYEIINKIIPDEAQVLHNIIENESSAFDMIFTTGGTGIGPRDITVETIRPLLEKEIPGIMEFIRVRYGSEKPNALLSRSIAGIRGKTLVYTLPGSVKAVEEYMSEIVKTLKHTVLMQYGVDTHRAH